MDTISGGIMEIQRVSSKGVDFLIQEEGLVLKPYKDSVGIPTIGVGCTYYEDGKKVKMTDPAISKDRATSLFRNLLKNYELGVYSVTRDDLNQNQFDALVSLCFNIGVHAFKTSTVLKRVNANPLDKSIEEAFLMWRFAGDGEHDGRDNDGDGKTDEPGEKKDILKGRRKREAGLYFTVCSRD